MSETRGFKVYIEITKLKITKLKTVRLTITSSVKHRVHTPEMHSHQKDASVNTEDRL